jgi:hypothetical protein
LAFGFVAETPKRHATGQKTPPFQSADVCNQHLEIIGDNFFGVKIITFCITCLSILIPNYYWIKLMQRETLCRQARYLPTAYNNFFVGLSAHPLLNRCATLLDGWKKDMVLFPG